MEACMRFPLVGSSREVDFFLFWHCQGDGLSEYFGILYNYRSNAFAKHMATRNRQNRTTDFPIEIENVDGDRLQNDIPKSLFLEAHRNAKR